MAANISGLGSKLSFSPYLRSALRHPSLELIVLTRVRDHGSGQHFSELKGGDTKTRQTKALKWSKSKTFKARNLKLHQPVYLIA